MQIASAYKELGSRRTAAKLCGTTPKTVRRVVERQRQSGVSAPRKEREKNTDAVADLVTERVRVSDGRISANRLLAVARAAGYEGSARNLRREPTGLPALDPQPRPAPGDRLDARRRAADVRRRPCLVAPSLPALRGRSAACLVEIWGVPGLVLSDRMAGLRASEVAGLVVPHPDYVRLAAHYGFRPDFCQKADPESKGCWST